MNAVDVVGIGSTRFGKLPQYDVVQLGVEAAEAAIRDSGLERERIGAVYLGNFISGPLTGQEVLAGLVADHLGLGNVACTKVEGACASGGIAFRHAYLAVASGLCDVALAVGVEKMSSASTSATTAALNCAMDNGSDGPSGLTFPGLFGLVWRAYEQRYGLTREQVSAVVRKNKGNGLSNPLAQMGREVTDEEIAEAALICDPIRLFDCCPVSDGAAALVLARADVVPGATPTIRVRASVQTRGSARIAGHPDLCSFDATSSAALQAYEQAGLRAADIDVVELHDCFSIAEIVDGEDLGLMPRGQGGHWALEGRTARDGDRPINPSGGCWPRDIRWVPRASGNFAKWCVSSGGNTPTRCRTRAWACPITWGVPVWRVPSTSWPMKMPDKDPSLSSVTVLRCNACGALDPGPRSFCPACHGAGMAAVDVPGTGRLVSWTTIRRAPTAFREQAPYHVAVVDLDAGVRITGRLLLPQAGCRPGDGVVCVDLLDDIPLFGAAESNT